MITFLVIGVAGVLLLLASLVIGDVLADLDLGSDLLSGAALAAFLGAFGFGGAIAYDASDSTGVAIGVGIVVGLLVGALVGVVSAQLQRGGDEATVRSRDLTGRSATVVSPIPEDGYGEVSVVIAGHITKLNARARSTLTAGTPVTITAVLSATSVSVEPRESAATVPSTPSA